MVASRGGQPPTAHRGQSCLTGRTTAHRGHGCLTGRTTTNGPQGAWLPHGEDNSPKGPQGAWLPHGEVLLFHTHRVPHFDRLSLSRSWSIQAGSAPTAERPEELVSWWWTGGAVAVEAFLKRRTWSGRLAVPLMPWHGGFSSLGVSLASDHKATQEELVLVTMVSPFVWL